MWYVIGGLLVFLAWRGWKGRETPSMAMFGGIDSTVQQLQRIALESLPPVPPTGDPPFDAAQMLRQTATVLDTIRLVYSVEHADGGFLHTLSSQLVRRRSKSYQAQCMLIAILTLQRQWTAAGLSGKDVPMRIEESEKGTHLVFLAFTAEHHERLRKVIQPV